MGAGIGKGDRPKGQEGAAGAFKDTFGVEAGVLRAGFLEVATAAGASGVCGSLHSMVVARIGVEAWDWDCLFL